MRPGTVVRLPDGRVGTVVYHNLDGYGIIWGEVEVDVDKILDTAPLFGGPPHDWPYEPEAMLREPYPSAALECVGEEFEIVSEKEKP